MANQIDITPRENIDRLLASRGSNPLKSHLYAEADIQIQADQHSESSYKHFVLETQPGGQQEIHELREYPEADLTRIATRPDFRFRWKCRRLLELGERTSAIEPGSLEFEQQATLLWAELIPLSEYLGISAEIDELVSALHSAYAQYTKSTTPKAVVEALVLVFRIVDRYTRLPSKAVDEALDALEKVGVDLNYPMASAKEDA